MSMLISAALAGSKQGECSLGKSCHFDKVGVFGNDIIGLANFLAHSAPSLLLRIMSMLLCR